MKRRRQVPTNQSQEDSTTGSPAPGEPVFLAVGRLRRSHGIAGEMIMDVLTDFPERLRPGRIVYMGDMHEPIRLDSVRNHDRAMIVHLEGVQNPEEVARFRNAILYIKATDLPALPEDEYYHHQLLGLTAVDESGQVLGKLANILETGANDVYVVQTPDGKELLLPAIEDVVLEVDLEHQQIRVRPPEWL